LKRNAIRIIAVTLVLCIVGCASATYKPHPGAINLLDSQAYDMLISTKAVIDQTKADLAGGVWSANIAGNVKTVLNTGVIPAYNVLDTTYQAYHLAAQPTAPGAALQASMNNLSTQMTNLSSAKVGQ